LIALIAVPKSSGEEVLDQSAKRLAFSLLATLEIPQNWRIDVDGCSGHDDGMIAIFASDVHPKRGTRPLD
jgi:hypothetical protein